MDAGKTALLICSFAIFTGISAKTIAVCTEKSCTYKSISAALKVANDGDIILVGGGFYYEGNLIINKSVSLISDENAVLDGEMKYEILTITAPNVIIKGFCFQNTGRTPGQTFSPKTLINLRSNP